MAADPLFDLTDKRISDTYDGLIHTDGAGNFYDGLGNPIDVGSGSLWEDGTITRVNDLVSEVTKGVKTFTIARDVNNLIESIFNGSQTITFNRINGQIVDWAVS